MSYAQSVLQPGEIMVATGRLHWTIYWPTIASFVVGVVAVWLAHKYLPTHDVLITATMLIFGALFVGTFAYAWFVRWITEFAITDRRVIYKRGFIWRITAEMNMDKVETVDVGQSILGRLLDYGLLQVKGTGSGQGIVVKRIGSPIALRNAITAK
jgi:uncharacterized membrane protein YdbT with pleckstrin-like domain